MGRKNSKRGGVTDPSPTTPEIKALQALSPPSGTDEAKYIEQNIIKLQDEEAEKAEAEAEKAEAEKQKQKKQQQP